MKKKKKNLQMDSIQTQNEFLWGGLLILSFSTLLMTLSLTALMWEYDFCYWWWGGVRQARTGASNVTRAAGLYPFMHSDIWGVKCVCEVRLRGTARQCFSCEQSQCNALLGASQQEERKHQRSWYHRERTTTRQNPKAALERLDCVAD